MTKPASKSEMTLSLPKSRMVRGYAIERMPLGRFLEATELLKDAPEDVLRRLFPEASPDEVLGKLASLTKDGLGAIFLSALRVLPEYVIRLFSRLSGLDEEKLLSDPAIGLDGFAEMIDAWIDVNGLENFTRAAGALWGKVRKTRLGFKS